MKELARGVYVHEYGPKMQSVIVTVGKSGDRVTDMSDVTATGKKKIGKWYVPRGANDRKLLDMAKMVEDSPNKGQFLETKANFIAGRGVALFTPDDDAQSVVLPVKSEVFREWKKRLRLDDYVMQGANQVGFGYEINVLLTLDTKTKKVAKLQVLDNNDVRMATLKPKELRFSKGYVSPDFGFDKTLREDQVTGFPIFDPNEPTKHLVSVIHEIVPTVSQKVYGNAAWWGTKSWTLQANKVPVYYEAAFRNGYIITHHITIPDDYWDVDDWNEERRAKEKQNTLDAIAESLSGIENANKLIFTFGKMTTDGKLMKNIEIKPLEFNINDEAFIKMFEAANKVSSQGHGVPGKLAGIDMGSNMGTSGLEINSLASYVQNYLVTQQRYLLLKPLEYARMIDGIEPSLDLGIKNIMAYVYDSTKQSDPANPDNQNNNNSAVG